MAGRQLHDALRLYVGKDAYHLVADASPAGPAQTLVVTRRTGEISVSSDIKAPADYEKLVPVHALYGLISLPHSDYLIFVTGRKRVARLFNTDVFEAVDFAVYPVDPSAAGTSAWLANRSASEKALLALVKAQLYAGPSYFTYGSYDLTTRAQVQAFDGSDKRPFWQRADDRFFFNRYLQSRFIDFAQRSPERDIDRFIVPFIFGFVEFKAANINGNDFTFGLVSRRSRHRAGTRYFSRGIDRDGNVSNFNETEMIALLDAAADASQRPSGPIQGLVRCSYVQTRGSVPVNWSEINNLRYKPDLQIRESADTKEQFQRHFDTQVKIYGDQYLVNLVNKGGYEKPVKEAYERAVESAANPQVHYTYFDFHHECKGLRFDRVSVLIDRLGDALEQQGFFYHDSTVAPRPQRTQSSVVRTNCMDCLDRTNVVQSALAKNALNQQLKLVGILGQKETIDDHPKFIHAYRNMWADNADRISKGYSGTGALKTDYTRTGKRTKQGAAMDGVNSAMRYIKNNFLDGPRQDAYDLMTGAWRPKKGEDPDFADTRPLLVRIMPTVALVAATLLWLSFWASASFTRMFGDSRRWPLLLFATLSLALVFMFYHGVEYVAWPKLAKEYEEALNYEGAGYQSGRHGRGGKRSSASKVRAARRSSAAEIEAGKKRVD